MFCHIVPKTYLKSWKNPETTNSIYIFKKENIMKKGENKNLDNLPYTGFGEKDYYYLPIERCKAKIYDFLFEDLFRNLSQDYNFYYKDKIINDHSMFRNCYVFHIDNIIVLRKVDNVEIKIKRLLSQINNLWNDEKKKFIENFFSKNLENNWNNALEEMISIVTNNVNEISRQTKDTLILFITLQLYRNHNYIKTVVPFFQCLSKDYLKDFTLDTLINFILIFDGKAKDSNNLIYKCYQEMKKSTFCYEFINTNTTDFIVSDTPIIFSQKNKKDIIIFPITPFICLEIYSSKQEKIIKRNENLKYVKEVNNLSIKNSLISVAYSKDDITNLI